MGDGGVGQRRGVVVEEPVSVRGRGGQRSLVVAAFVALSGTVIAIGVRVN